MYTAGTVRACTGRDTYPAGPLQGLMEYMQPNGGTYGIWTGGTGYLLGPGTPSSPGYAGLPLAHGYAGLSPGVTAVLLSFQC